MKRKKIKKIRKKNLRMTSGKGGKWWETPHFDQFGYDNQKGSKSNGEIKKKEKK